MASSQNSISNESLHHIFSKEISSYVFGTSTTSWGSITEQVRNNLAGEIHRFLKVLQDHSKYNAEKMEKAAAGTGSFIEESKILADLKINQEIREQLNQLLTLITGKQHVQQETEQTNLKPVPPSLTLNK